MASLLDLGPGSVIAERYRIVRPLSAGGMGAVYVAEQIATKKLRALKVMLPELVGDEKLRARFVQEAQIGAAIDSEHVVEVIDAGIDADRGIPWMAMELLEGETLASLSLREGALGARLVRDVLEQLCHALGHAHDKGIVHRDLKPENVFLASSRRVGVAFTVKVLDFGIAKLLSEAHTRVTGAIGTPLYMAPEQMVPGANIAAPTDVWAMGLVAFQLLTGRSYWLAASAEGSTSVMLMNEVATLPLERPSERAKRWESADRIPQGFDEWFGRCVCREIGDRWPNARAAWEAAAPVLGNAPPGHYPSIAPTPSRKRERPTDPASSSSEPTDAWLDRKQSAASAEAPTELPEGASVQKDASTGAVRPTSKPILADVSERRAPRRRLLGAGLGAAGLSLLVALGGYRYFWSPGKSAAPVTHSASASAPVEARASLLVHSLACSAAALDGEGATDALAKSIGIGACARLAVDLGVDWSDKAGEPLAVRATLREAGTEVSLAVGDRSAQGQGPTPMDAMIAATTAIEPSLAAPPASDDFVRAWGARDAASARRIQRAWRRLLLNLSPDDEAAARALIDDDPGSAWAYTLLAAMAIRGTDVHMDAIPKGLALVDKLPPARAKGLKGTLLFIRSPADQKEGLALLQKAYAEAPDDPEIAGLYASTAFGMGDDDEGIAVTERLYERSPTNSVIALLNGQKPEGAHDLARDGRYVARLAQLFPESVAWGGSIQHLALEGKFDEARQAVAFGERLGVTGTSVTSANLTFSHAVVEMDAHEPGAARDLAREILASPRASVSADAADVVINSYMLEGRVVDGESAFLREIDRQRSSASTLVGTSLIGDFCRARRWLGDKPPADELLDWAEAEMKRGKMLSPGGEALLRVDLALARARKTPARAKEIAGQALTEIEKLADDAARGQRWVLDSMLVQTVPLVRVARGDKAAAERWRETDHAAFLRRRFTALDAGLVLEAIGDKDGAREAYRLSQDAVFVHEEGLATLAAMIKEARLDEATGHKPDAERLSREIDRLMKNADKGVRAKLEALE